MQSLAVSAIMIGLIFFWTMAGYESSSLDQRRAEAIAANFVVYRNAVHRHVFAHKTAGSVSLAELNLPQGFSAMAWQNQTVLVGGQLHCYVFGPASIETIAAVRRLLRGSATIGWNNNGQLVRSGQGLALPNFIADREIVSVIVVDG